MIDAATGKSADAIKLSGHPEAFVLEKDGSRMFVNIPGKQHIGAQAKIIATWKTDGASANFPLALDETNHRLFSGCRMPAKLIVLNTDSGDVVTSIAISGDPDDIFYDDMRHRIYVVCGAGSVDVIKQTDRDTYTASDKVETASGANRIVRSGTWQLVCCRSPSRQPRRRSSPFRRRINFGRTMRNWNQNP